ncbi:divalent cation transporter [Coraliomargarita sinensis]|uniref:Divalent cation transporter n=1 Tax=Coraliomargarita sinensis TaxID=2174842 RepID=A0A317ZQB8_9BACT|nr:divalent cation transporter [Coraliomargarita sinensis]PXA05611.1 divalent cation transporter [Coraliomargarita sinensis]
MSDLLVITGAAWLAGIAAFSGGSASQLEGSGESERKQELIHGIVAFGGGILLAAVAFALTPEGIKVLPTIWLAVSFVSGGVIFCLLDAYITRKEGNKAQFMAMLLDFVPEALALGALFSQSRESGLLLALFIGAQNLPEGFNAHRESIAGGISPKASLMTLLAVSTLGPVCAVAGYFFLSDLKTLNACIMTAAGGGILYLIFQDIAPQAKLQRHWAPPLGAVLGFGLGMVAHQLLS